MKNHTISNIRVFLTILVLLGHSTYVYAGWWNFSSKRSVFADYITKLIYSFHMPLFMSLSGYVFAYAYFKKIKNIRFLNFLINRFRRLIIPLIFFKFVVMNPVYYSIGSFDVKSVKSLVALGHLWFLCVLFIYSIALFGIIKILPEQVNFNIFIISLLLFSTVISILSPSLPFSHISLVSNVYTYFFYFVYGIILCHFSIISTNRNNYIYPLIIGFLIFNAAYFAKFDNNLLIVINAFVFVNGFWGLFEKIRIADKLPLYKTLEVYSMPIYLFHLPIMYLIIFYTKICDILEPLLAITILFASGLSISLLFGYLLRKNNFTKLLIGEK